MNKQQREWHIYLLFLIRCTGQPEWADGHCEWLKRGSMTPSEWMGREGDELRQRWRMQPMNEQLKKQFSEMLKEHKSTSSYEFGYQVGYVCAEMERKYA